MSVGRDRSDLHSALESPPFQVGLVKSAYLPVHLSSSSSFKSRLEIREGESFQGRVVRPVSWGLESDKCSGCSCLWAGDSELRSQGPWLRSQQAFQYVESLCLLLEM